MIIIRLSLASQGICVTIKQTSLGCHYHLRDFHTPALCCSSGFSTPKLNYCLCRLSVEVSIILYQSLPFSSSFYYSLQVSGRKRTWQVIDLNTSLSQTLKQSKDICIKYLNWQKRPPTTESIPRNSSFTITQVRLFHVS